MSGMLWRSAAVGSLAVWLAGCGGGGGGPTEPSVRTFQPLEFPFANPGDIVRMAAFGIPNWSGSEPHNGIDLVIDASLASTRIISPTAGEVVSISMSENPYSNPVGQLILTVSIRVNSEWQVNLVLEPGTADPALKSAQRAAVLVTQGQTVAAGTPVADLMVGTLGYPHLHHMVERNRQTVCAYAHSSEAARRMFQDIARLPNSNVPGGNICYGQP